jgi:hypothetical protein
LSDNVVQHLPLLLLLTTFMLHSLCLQACRILRSFNLLFLLRMLLLLLLQGWPLLPALPALRIGCLFKQNSTIHAQHRTGRTTGPAAHIKCCHLSSSIGWCNRVQAVCREQSRVWWHLS